MGEDDVSCGTEGAREDSVTLSGRAGGGKFKLFFSSK